MSPIQIVLLVCICNMTLFSLTFFYLHLRFHDPCLKYWTFGWLLPALENGLVFMLLSGFVPPFLMPPAFALSIIGMLFLSNGISLHSGEKQPRWVLAAGLTAAGLSMLLAILPLPDAARIAITFTHYAMVLQLGYPAISLIRLARKPNLPLLMMIAGLCLLLVYHVGSILIDPADVHPELFLLYALSSLLLSIGMLNRYLVRLQDSMQEENRALKATQDSLRTFSRAVEQSASAIVMTDANGNIRYVNPRFCLVTGYSRTEALGRNPRILKSGQHPDTLYKELWTTINAGRDWRGEMINRKKDGSPYWAILTISPIKDDAGRNNGFIAVQEDISPLKALQDELSRKNNELSAVLTSLQDAQTQMVEQEKRVGIGMLAAGVAHEINNPLAFLSSNLDTLARHVSRLSIWLTPLIPYGKSPGPEGGDPAAVLLANLAASPGWNKADRILADLAEMVPDMQEGMRRISDIVDSLRDFSQVDTGAVVTDYDLNRHVRHAAMLASGGLDAASAPELDLGPTDMIQANGEEINQVLMILITNAFEASRAEHGGTLGHIRLRTRQLDSCVSLVVEDDGAGVPEDIRTRIFEPFFTTKPVGQGTGLGLGIAQDVVVRRHKGQLIVDRSELGGARFTVCLPLHLHLQESGE